MNEQDFPRFSGKALRAARDAAGLSRFKLSQAIDFEVQPASIDLYEKDLRTPKFNVAIRLARVLNVSLKDLTDATG